MMNGLFTIVPSWRVSPDNGGAIGPANVTFYKPAVAGATVAEGSDGRLAGQGIVGPGARSTRSTSKCRSASTTAIF
jgi:hypothetical protein